MKLALKSICLQPPNTYVKKCSILLDEYLCSCYGRYMKIKTNSAFQIQLQLRQQNEISKTCHNDKQDEFGIKTYIPSTLKGSP